MNVYMGTKTKNIQNHEHIIPWLFNRVIVILIVWLCVAGLFIEYMIKLKTRGARTLIFYHCWHYWTCAAHHKISSTLKTVKLYHSNIRPINTCNLNVREPDKRPSKTIKQTMKHDAETEAETVETGRKAAIRTMSCPCCTSMKWG